MNPSSSQARNHRGLPIHRVPDITEVGVIFDICSPQAEAIGRPMKGSLLLLSRHSVQHAAFAALSDASEILPYQGTSD